MSVDGKKRNVLTKKTGFFAYFVSNLVFFYSPLIREQYDRRHEGLAPTVQINDIWFAGHGFLMSVITASQYFLPHVWGFRPSHGGKPSRFIMGVFSGCIIGVVFIVLVVLRSPYRNSIDEDVVRSSWVWLDATYAISYVKLVVTLIKYTPQVVVNYKNKSVLQVPREPSPETDMTRSTVGWSISQILLDFAGGVLSITQQGIDSYLQGDWSGITGNPVKFALGNVSMMYDVVFVTQHYVLYPGGKEKDAETDSLLGREPEDEERRIA